MPIQFARPLRPRRVGLATGRRVLGGLFLAAALLAAPCARASDPSALWHIVHDHCVPDQQEHARPQPCAQVSLDGGWAVLKDREGVAQYLLIPTARVSGIEDAAVLAPDAPDYFAAAWAARDDVLERLGRPLPRDALSLAINSPSGRSQNQLHIHIDCLRPDVRAALHAQADRIGVAWAPFPGGLLGRPYLARRVERADLAGVNPFRLLAGAPEVGAGGIGTWTLVVTGASFRDADGHGTGDGFILLADRADLGLGDRGNGEELQDHGCALAHASD